MIINPVFPTPVGIEKFESGLSNKEIDFIKNLEKRPNMGNLTSVDTYLLSLKPMARLKKFFTEAVNSYFQEVYQPKFDVELRITQTWANYSERGMFHHYHAHPNSFVSGVFYVQTNESDKIFFNKNIYENIQIPTENFNLFNSMSWWFPAEVNN